MQHVRELLGTMKTLLGHSDRNGQSPHLQALPTHALALRSRRVLDIAPRTARVIAFAGATGVVFLVVGSLLGNRPATIGVDKMLHLSGYAVLAALFILSLRPRWYLPALAGLAALGLLIEFVQPLNRRTFDLGDALFNAVGLAIGAAAGLGVRLTYGYVKTELASACVRRNLIGVEPGATIVREGAHIDQFFIVKSGTVALYQQGDGERVLVSSVEPGETPRRSRRRGSSSTGSTTTTSSKMPAGQSNRLARCCASSPPNCARRGTPFPASRRA
jgi:hypothetical protein